MSKQSNTNMNLIQIYIPGAGTKVANQKDLSKTTCQCEAFAKHPKLLCRLIFCFFHELHVNQHLFTPPATMSSLIIFNHTYLKCIFIFNIHLVCRKSAGEAIAGKIEKIQTLHCANSDNAKTSHAWLPHASSGASAAI